MRISRASPILIVPGPTKVAAPDEAKGGSEVMDIWGVIVLVLGAAALGLIGQYVFSGARFGLEWIVTGIGALVGGFVVSEVFRWEWWVEVGGLYILPALIGGVVLGGAIWLVARSASSSAPAGRPT